jgi:hypothetical protein
MVALAASLETVCALDPDGQVWCATNDASVLTPRTDVPPLSRLVGAFLSFGRFCGLPRSDSRAWCWDAETAPALVPGSPAFVDLAIEGSFVDEGFSCGIRTDSTAACWGSGLLGDGSAEGSETPVAVHGGRRFASIAVGEGFGCGREADGELWCWGRNSEGQLGSGTPGPDQPLPILAATGVTSIAASMDMLLAAQGPLLRRWGSFDGFSGTVESLAHLEVNIVGGSVACVTSSDGQVYCFDEIWDRSTRWSVDSYSPVHPPGPPSR